MQRTHESIFCNLYSVLHKWASGQDENFVISADFKFLGYHCYSVAGHDKQEDRDEIIGKMAMFCGRWARRCGIALTDEGEPSTIGDEFWYDDGVWAWHQEGNES